VDEVDVELVELIPNAERLDVLGAAFVEEDHL
jgi:hypothetical protein